MFMNIKSLLREARGIWGSKKLSLEEIVVRQGVVTGDISRYARDKADGKQVDEAELKKELGNLIFSTIRWCDDLGYNPEACIELAKRAQAEFRDSIRG